MQRPVQPVLQNGWNFGGDDYDAYVSINGERCTSGARAPQVKRCKCGLLPAFPLVRTTSGPSISPFACHCVKILLRIA